jgi:hypothetical protein
MLVVNRMSDSVSVTIGSYAGYVSMAMMIVGTVIAAVNRRRCRSACCGHEATVELNIEPTTPPDQKPTINV